MSLDAYLNDVRSTDISVKTIVCSKLMSHLQTKNSSLVCENLKLLIDSVITWLRSSNHKIALTSADVLILFSLRLKNSFKPYVSNIVLTSIEKLGDQRTTVQDKLRELIIAMIEVSGYKIVVGYFEPAFTHRLSRIRHQTLILIYEIINKHGFEEFLLVKSIPSICFLLSDSNLEIQEMAFKVLLASYGKFGPRIRALVNKQPRIPPQKISLLNQHFDSTQVDSSSKTVRVKMPSRAFASFKFRPNEVKEAGAVDEAMFLQSFEDSVPIIAGSQKDLQEKVSKMKTLIGNSNADWEARIQALKQLRYLVETDSSDFDSASFRSWALPLKTSLSDLRSQVARESAITISFISHKLGNRFSYMAELIFPTVLHLIQNSAKVVSTSCIVCGNFVIKNTKSSKLLPIVCNGLDNKSSIIKRYACDFLLTIMGTWSVAILERNLHLLEMAIHKGIEDSDPQARIFSRKSFWHFSAHFPLEAASLYHKLDSTRQKGLKAELSVLGSLPNGVSKRDIEDKICGVPNRSYSVDRKIPRPGTVSKPKSFLRANTSLSNQAKATSLSDVSLVSNESLSKQSFHAPKFSVSVRSKRSSSLHDRSLKENFDSSSGSLFTDVSAIISLLTNKLSSDRRIGLSHLSKLIESGLETTDAQLETLMKLLLKLFQDAELSFPTCFSVCKQIVSKHSHRLSPLLVRSLLQQLLVKLATKILPSTERSIKSYLETLPQFFSPSMLMAAVYQLMRDKFLIKSCNMMSSILEFLTMLMQPQERGEFVAFDDDLFQGVLWETIEYLRSPASTKNRETAMTFITHCRGQMGHDFLRLMDNMPQEHIDTVNYVLSNYFSNNASNMAEECLEVEDREEQPEEVELPDDDFLALILSTPPSSIVPDQFKSGLSRSLAILGEASDPSACSLSLKVIQFLVGNFTMVRDDSVRIIEVLVGYYSDPVRFKDLKTCPCIRLVMQVFPKYLVLNTLIDQVNHSESLHCPLKMLCMVIRTCTPELLLKYMSVLVETLTGTLKNQGSIIRMNTVYCMVSMQNVLGNEFYQHFPLNHMQLKLVKVYVDRERKALDENNSG